MDLKRKINFLLYGENSTLNKGCEAIVKTTIEKIQKECDGTIVVATKDIKNDAEVLNSEKVKCIKQNFDGDELENSVISANDIFLSIGGDNYSYGEPKWLYSTDKKIKSQNKKNVLWSASLYDEIQSDEMIGDLKTFDVVMVRESLSYNAIKKYVDEDRILKLPDTAFSLEKKEVQLPEIFSENKKVVGINISPLINKYTDNQNKILESVMSLINYILKETDYNIALIPHVYIEENNDLDSLSAIKEKYSNEKRIQVLDEKIYSCEELKFIISKCSFCIAARTHASIAAYSSLVPTLVIGYSVKSKGISLDLFGQYEKYVIPVDQITPENLVENFKFIKKNEKEIIDTLQEKMPKIIDDAQNLVKLLLERLDYLDNKYVTQKNKCTGCMACLNICPNNAIEIITSKDGFKYPKINEEKCINCNICRKVCPSNKLYKNTNLELECYAAYNSTNEQERKESSSGGIVSLIANNVLGNSGTVYGAAFVNKNLEHIRIENKNDLNKIRGSKYLQSNINLIYRNVKQDLSEGKQVLFTGTPCQIEGLNSYLNGKKENLITISVICHGVPSPEIFKKYIEENERKNSSKIKKVVFRDKQNGWHKYCVRYEYENGTIERIPFTEDAFMNGFLKDMYLRESCYNCQMKFENKNTADIILGDFWGIENVFNEMDDNKGISAVIINSEKGKQVFEQIKNKVDLRKTEIENIIKYNPSLINAVEYTKRRDDFFELMENNEISTYINVLKYEKIDTKLQEKLYKEVQLLNEWVDDLKKAKEFFLEQMKYKDELIREKDEQIENIKENEKKEKEKLQKELQDVYDSKRWKLINSIGNIYDKATGKK